MERDDDDDDDDGGLIMGFGSVLGWGKGGKVPFFFWGGEGATSLARSFLPVRGRLDESALSPSLTEYVSYHMM